MQSYSRLLLRKMRKDRHREDVLIEVAARLESKKKEKKAAELLMSDLFRALRLLCSVEMSSAESAASQEAERRLRKELQESSSLH